MYQTLGLAQQKFKASRLLCVVIVSACHCLCSLYPYAEILKNRDCSQDCNNQKTQHAMLHAQYSFQRVSPPKGRFLRKWGRMVWVFLVGRHLRARAHNRKELYRCTWIFTFFSFSNRSLGASCRTYAYLGHCSF